MRTLFFLVLFFTKTWCYFLQKNLDNHPFIINEKKINEDLENNQVILRYGHDKKSKFTKKCKASGIQYWRILNVYYCDF